MALKFSALSKLSAPDRQKAFEGLARAAAGKPNGQLRRLDRRIGEFEQRYEMTSAEMRTAFRDGKVSDTADIAKWMVLLDARTSAAE